MTPLQQLLNLVWVDDPFAAAPDNLLEIQLAAAQERLEQRRKQIRVLDQRAIDRGVARIERPQDIVPLLFSDATYKSYPEVFVDQCRWDRLALWFQTLSADPITGVDFKSIQTIDDWVAALSAKGIWVNSSSGTSGKSSFLAMNRADMDVAVRLMLQAARWSSPNLREGTPNSMPAFVLGPSRGAYSGALRSKLFAQAIARAGDIHFISDVPQTAQDGLDLARLNRAIAAGTAKPSDLQAFQEKTRARTAQVQADLAMFLDRLVERSKEPIILLGLSSVLYQIMEMAKARGLDRLPLHPGSFVALGGGRKGLNAPPDFNERMIDYFSIGERAYTNPYGMTEMSGCCPSMARGQGWPIPPWIVPIVLEATSETLLVPEGGTGEVTGRFAFVDLLVEGRWGALVTGDQVTVDYSGATPGVRVAIIRKVDRYKDLPGDDKATCAGTIDSYVRGVLEAA
jgi:hypothetical protein